MISCIEWVPKGAADPNPKKYEEPSAAETKLLQEHQAEAAAITSVSQDTTPSNNLPADLRMDEYSSDEEDNDVAIGDLLVGKQQEEEEVVAMATDTQDAKEEDSDDTDEDDIDSDDDLRDVPDTREFMPLNVEGFEAMGLTNTGGFLEEDEEYDDQSDAEDVRISPNDAILVVAKTEEDFASLEVHVYEQDSGNLFVHHDIALPSFPLTLAHGDINCNGGAGNYCAVGTFHPGIEVWNLDVLNPLEPMCVLGSDENDSNEQLEARVLGKKVKKRKKQSGLHHTDAIMTLSWNKVHRQVIASGSADSTVKLWDITQANTAKACASTFTHHSDKVQSVAWHPTEGTLLATGSYDKTVALVDARSSSSNSKRVKIPGDSEALEWDPFHTHLLTSASDDGTITCFDVRKFNEQPLWSFVANEYGGVSDLSYNSHVPGMMVTCAVDKTITLWDTYQNNNGTFEPLNTSPHACGTKEMGVGKLYSIGFYPSSPFLLGCGGGGNEVALWDLSREEAVQNRFGARVGSNHAESSLGIKEKEEKFEAIMAAGDDDEAAEKVRTTRKKKKKGSKGKKKVHRKGR